MSPDVHLSLMGGLRTHIIHDSFGPSESDPQNGMSIGLAVLQGSQSLSAHRQTHRRIIQNVTTVRCDAG